MTRRYRVIAPASSSNLGPGFDSLGLAVKLALAVTVRADDPAGFRVRVNGEGSSILPEDGRNRVLKAAREIAGSAVDRASWEIDSEIPIARGLGSSASARAGGLAAGYLLRDGQLPPRHEIFNGVTRTENHPDNAAASVFGGLRVAGRDDGGGWESWPGVLGDPSIRLLLVIPQIPVSTQVARSMLPTAFSRAAAVHNLQFLATLLSGLARSDWGAVRAGCRDFLHEPYRLPLVPGLKEALENLRANPATGGAYLSGAGPILAAFLPDPEQGIDVGDEAKEILENHGTKTELRVLDVQEDGLSYEEL